MSWAAHQFEYYALQGHMPKRWVGQVSFLAIVIGDQSCDFFGKVWTYGIDIGDTHYGPAQPAQWHRGWPGLGPTHSVIWAFVFGALVYFLSRGNRAWTIGAILGAAMHALTDITDSVGTMVLWPVSTENWSVGAWAYAATAEGGKYLDGAAYYSSWGFVMDTMWFVLALTGWRCLRHDYWKTNIVGADPRAWAWLGRRMPERALVTLYRAWFIYALTRLVAWTAWAHAIEDYQFDFTWGGPSWIPQADLSHPEPAQAVIVLVCGLVIVFVAVNQLMKLPLERWGRR